MGRTLRIDPVTRLEGHGRIEIFLDERGEVANAYFQVPELRGFEAFCRGRALEDMPFITARLCGVCPAAHQMASAMALDEAYGAAPPPAARKLRELMYMAHFVQSHLAHFFVLAAPDFLCGPDADPAERNILGVAARLGREAAKEMVAQRGRAQEAQAILGGRATHMNWMLPGGVSRPLQEADRETLQAWGLQAVDFAQSCLDLFGREIMGRPEHRAMIASDPYALAVHDMALVDAEGRTSLCGGRVRVTGPQGGEIDSWLPPDYLGHLAERVEPWTCMKFPYLRKVGWTGFEEGAASGVYRSTPLSRLNASTGLATPRAQAAREEMLAALGGAPIHATLATHWARLVELLHAAERWAELAADPETASPEVRTPPAREPLEGVGCVEAPRGLLTHHYTADALGRVRSVNLLVGTTNNNAPIAMSVRRAARGLIRRGVEVTEGVLNRIEMALRAYDPCLSCATHSLPGQLPLVLTVREADGSVAQRVCR